MTPNAITLALVALLLVSPVALCVVRMREERTLWLGFWAMAAAASVVGLLEVALLSLPGANDSSVVRFASIALVAVLAVALLAFPVVLVVTLIASGVRLVRREGARPANLLSLGLGIVLVAYVTVWPALRQGLEGLPLVGGVFDLLFSVATVPIAVAGAAFALYTVSGLVAQVPHPRRRYRYVVALGSGLAQGRRVTPLLAHRVDRAIRAWRDNPGSTIVMSGGQGPDEELPEARAMCEYALGQGVPARAILCEERSRNTRENVAFSRDLIRRHAASAQGAAGEKDAADPGRILVVTDDYHVFRALLLTREEGVRADGVGAHVRLYFSLNALVREWVAYAVLRKRVFAAIAVAALVVNLALWAATHLL
ncbi:MAG: YdcF family protein [Parafannyhessea sp.]|uniref:YdcF family protein n=1 Tax=Parafannyhessea sp. TaxID=2847324 RepID=UPI003F071340